MQAETGDRLATPARDGTRGAAGGLRTRVLAALALAPLVLLVTWAGALWFLLLVLAGGTLMAHEWVTMVHERDGGQLLLHLAAFFCAVLAAAWPAHAAPLLILSALAWAASIARTARSMRGFTTFHVLGAPYLALAGFAVVALRQTPGCGLHAIFFLFAVVWSADSLAYFAGRAFGGPKFAPRISPKKTWSGFFGAVAGGALAGSAFALLTSLPVATPALLGALLGGFEQFGDLFESAAKRRFGVKDSGSIIPGHGGVLDRVDGLVAAAMLALLIGTAASGSWVQAGCGLFKPWGWP